jgi:hypothetical protein
MLISGCNQSVWPDRIRYFRGPANPDLLRHPLLRHHEITLNFVEGNKSPELVKSEHFIGRDSSEGKAIMTHYKNIAPETSYSEDITFERNNIMFSVQSGKKNQKWSYVYGDKEAEKWIKFLSISLKELER